MGTKTINISKLRDNLADALDAVSEDEVLIITRRGKKEKAVVDLDMLEDLLAASNPEYLKSIEEARNSNEYFTHEEIFGNLD